MPGNELGLGSSCLVLADPMYGTVVCIGTNCNEAHGLPKELAQQILNSLLGSRERQDAFVHYLFVISYFNSGDIVEDEDDYLDDALCQHLVADAAEDMPEGCESFTSIDPSNKSGQNPQLYKGKFSTFFKLKPEGSLLSFPIICIFIVGPLKVRIICLVHVHAQSPLSQ